MSDSRSRGARMSRESRVLLLTVVVCIAVLLMMARLRFPEAAPAPEPAVSPPPLERLAARASYDALAADIERVEPNITPNLIVLRIVPRTPARPLALGDALAGGDSAAAIRHVAALRISEDVAIATLDSSAQIDGIVGDTGGGTASLLALDPVRRIARIRVPRAPVRQLVQTPLSALPTPLYVVVVEGTQAGVTVRPVFLGRGERFTSPRWSRPLLPLGGIGVSPGALLFSLSGEFIGSVVSENGAPAIVGARDVLESGERLASEESPTLSDPGFAVQPLTTPLRTALEVQRGVVVAAVDPGGPAAGRLEPADVITAVDEWSTDNPDELLLRIASRMPGESVTIALVRNGEPRTAAVTLRPVTAADEADDAVLRLTLERGVGTRIESAAGGSSGDLQAGDVIVQAGTDAAPGPAQVRRFLAQSTTSGFAVVVVRRDGRDRVVAVPTGVPPDARAR